MVDDKDIKLLKLLQKDGRMGFKELAERTGMSRGTVYNRIKALEQNGVIKRFIPLLDPKKLGKDITAFILIQAKDGKLVEVEDRLAKEPRIHSVYDITGEFDIAVVGNFINSEELSKFIKQLLATPYVSRSVTSLVLNIVKQDPRISL